MTGEKRGVLWGLLAGMWIGGLLIGLGLGGFMQKAVDARLTRAARPGAAAVPCAGVAVMGSYEVNPDVPSRVRASLWLPPDWRPGETLKVDTRNAIRRSDGE